MVSILNTLTMFQTRNPISNMLLNTVCNSESLELWQGNWMTWKKIVWLCCRDTEWSEQSIHRSIVYAANTIGEVVDMFFFCRLLLLESKVFVVNQLKVTFMLLTGEALTGGGHIWIWIFVCVFSSERVVEWGKTTQQNTKEQKKSSWGGEEKRSGRPWS